ncbi:hypothetical protein [Brevibacillus nitrificans]|uniref:hypothetical protein n=1 Tax=Brevibacillus nitrificans TaxID=651560 RepID=UPI00286071D2|nr:hypothetical protein [Brevibacillus nitrificans]MDR7314884.1 hypothetical protein [Brevibacillus nitrificans]
MKLSDMKISRLEYLEEEASWQLVVEFNLQSFSPTLECELSVNKQNPQSYHWQGFRYKDENLVNDIKARKQLDELTLNGHESILNQLMNHPTVQLDKLYWHLVTAREANIKFGIEETEAV